MGNCASSPKTDEGPEPMPESVTEGAKVETNLDTKTDEETPKNSDNMSLRTLLDQKVEETQKTEEVKAEAEEVKVKEENPKTEEAKIEA